jgi:hypothetical protein
MTRELGSAQGPLEAILASEDNGVHEHLGLQERADIDVQANRPGLMPYFWHG